VKYDFDFDIDNNGSQAFIAKRIREKSIVLEFGTANGVLTKYLRQELDCKVYGIELDPDDAAEASAFCEDIYVGDAEELVWMDKYKKMKFDYILFPDILEHLRQPQHVLENAKKLLKPSGSILISVPNITHNSIIMELLDGNFDYQKTGLLDETHIHFFTHTTLKKMLKDCDLHITYDTGIYIEPRHTEFQNDYADISECLRNELQDKKYGEVYQFVIEAKTTEDVYIEEYNNRPTATLYYDEGSGFSEDESIQSKFSFEHQNEIIFTFDTPVKEVNRIRIDPLEHALEIDISSLKVNADDYTALISHNGIEKADGTIIFLHDDPQISLTIEDAIVIDSITFEYKSFKKIYDVKERLLLEKEQKILEQEQQLQSNTQQLQEHLQQLKEKEVQLQEKEAYIRHQDTQVRHWHDVAQSLRVKNRIKRIIKKFIPVKLWTVLRHLRHHPSFLKEALQTVRHQGFDALLQKIEGIDTLPPKLIGSSYTYHTPEQSEAAKSEIEAFKKKPLISIIMPVYNVDPKWLELAVKSIEQQWYENWELCIVDDKSSNKETLQYLKKLDHPKIKVMFSEVNGNISVASNEALKLASGTFVALMDNDDELTPDALYEVVKAINTQDAEFIYSDEDKLEMDGTFCDPHFKPDYAPDMFLSQNYISHLGVIKKELIDKVDGFTVGLEGAQDYDLYLKVLEHTEKVFHIQKVLYHWRKIPGSTAAEFGEKSYAQEAGVKALQNAMNRRGIAAEVHNGRHPGTYRVQYEIKGAPLVSIIIPFKDKPELLTMCIESILEKTTYRNFEVIGISNNSEEQSTFDEMKRLESLDGRIKFYEYNVPFNYSDINNHAVRSYAKGEQILLLNNDIEIITPEWIEAMLEFSQREDVGVVGAKLYYPDDTVQHAGVIIGIGGIAGHAHKHFLRSDAGYFSRLDLVQNLSAVTAACFMVKREIFEEVDGLNENELKIAFNDVDFCLRIREKGYLNIYTPYCEAYHHESISRGVEDTFEKQERFLNEVTYMQKRHKDILQEGDPYYNPRLTLSREDFSLCEGVIQQDQT